MRVGLVLWPALCCLMLASSAAAVVDNNKPGFCPYSRTLRDNQAKGCFNDFDCESTEKCCYSEQTRRRFCVGIDSNAKSGKCPARHYLRGLAVDACGGDATCPSNKKCCPNGNRGMECAAPDSRDKPGVCPRRQSLGGSSLNNCNNDGSCEKTNKCCPNRNGGRECAGPVKDMSCPHPSTITDDNMQTCYKDFNCRSTEKCCRNKANRMVCARTDHQPKAGQCKDRLSLRGSAYQSCVSDYSCAGTQKCCPNINNGMECSEPRTSWTNKLGSCPTKAITGITCEARKKCVYDTDCPGSDKCCKDIECKRKACIPTQTGTSSRVAKIEEQNCPLPESLDNAENIHQCNTYENCHIGQICCPNRNKKGRCVKPSNDPRAARQVSAHDGVCPITFDTRYLTRCSRQHDCARGTKCCQSPNAIYYCAPYMINRLTSYGEEHKNDLIGRKFTLWEPKCWTIVDRDIKLTAGRRITAFQFFMISAQDKSSSAVATPPSTFPTVRLQLWRPVHTPQGGQKAAYQLACEDRIVGTKSVQRKLLFQIPTKSSCFSAPKANDKVGFTFEYQGDGHVRENTINPVPYDYDSELAHPRGTDYKVTDCKYPRYDTFTRVGSIATFDSDGTTYPARFSYGVVQEYGAP